MKIKGIIKTVRSITVDGDNCHGLYEGKGKDFIIRINQKIMTNHPNLFLRVLLHEILHLYMFIIDEYTHGKLNLTEGIQHKMMGKLVFALTRQIANRALQITKRK